MAEVTDRRELDLTVIVNYTKETNDQEAQDYDEGVVTFSSTNALEEKKRTFSCRDLPSSLLNKHPRVAQWIYCFTIQFFVCFLTFGTYYCYESPGGSEDAIIKIMKVDTAQYSLLFSISAWPSVVLCLIGGPLTDRVLGRRLSTVLLVSIVTLGQIIWAVGAFVDKFWAMLIGRFLIGIGARTLPTVLKVFTVVLFKRKLLAFSLSTTTTAARLGGAASLSFPQLVYEHLADSQSSLSSKDRLGLTILLLGGGIMVIGLLVITPLLIVMDKHGEKFFKKDNNNDEQKVTAKIKCSELKQFSGHFWLVAFIAIIFYPVVFSFSGIGEVFYVQKFGLSLTSSGVVVSFVFSATILATPVMGLLLDATGYYVTWVIVGLLCALTAHLILLISGGHFIIPYIAGVVYSISYTLVATSLWTLPGLLISTNQIATAYGLIYSPNMLVLAILTIVSGSIVDNAGYFILETTYCILMYTAILAAVLLWLSDTISKKPVVNAPGIYIKKLKKRITTILTVCSAKSTVTSSSRIQLNDLNHDNEVCQQSSDYKVGCVL